MTMKPPIAFHGTEETVLADGAWSITIILVVGVIVLVLLIGGFVLGARRRAQDPPPPSNAEQPHRPDRPTHLEENVDPSDTFPRGGERLTPHELGGHGDAAYQRPEDDEPDRGGSGSGGDQEGSPGGGSSRI
jgi:hypothetical protein